MESPFIVVTQGIMNLTTYTILVVVLMWPAVKKRATSIEGMLLPFVAFHLVRTLGLFGMIPELSGEKIAASNWAHHVAIGDVIAVLLAQVAVVLLIQKHKHAIKAVWIFNIVGFVDVLNAFYNAMSEQILFLEIGFYVFVVAFFVPGLVVTHIAIFKILLNQRSLMPRV